jgi:hypothetical protein
LLRSISVTSDGRFARSARGPEAAEARAHDHDPRRVTHSGDLHHRAPLRRPGARARRPSPRPTRPCRARSDTGPFPGSPGARRVRLRWPVRQYTTTGRPGGISPMRSSSSPSGMSRAPCPPGCSPPTPTALARRAGRAAPPEASCSAASSSLEVSVCAVGPAPSPRPAELRPPLRSRPRPPLRIRSVPGLHAAEDLVVDELRLGGPVTAHGAARDCGAARPRATRARARRR